MVDARPQTQTSFNTAQSPDLGTDISNLANGARQTASLFEEGGSAGLDIVNQFQQLFGRITLHQDNNSMLYEWLQIMWAVRAAAMVS